VTPETTHPLPRPGDTALPTPQTVRKASWRRALRVLWELLYDVSIALLVAIFAVHFIAQACRVEGTSMLPLLEDGERIVVNKVSYRFQPIRRGDVVVFWYPRDPSVSFIKRVVGLPGDTLEIRRGVLSVNGQSLREDYLRAAFRDDDDLELTEVEPGHYFVLGDHRNGSNDSRAWGAVPEKYIYGKALFRFWPLARLGFIEP
jgi:signal peptidase I